MANYEYDVIKDSTGVTNITLNASGVPTFTNSPQFNTAVTTYSSSPANIAVTDRYALIDLANGTVNLPAHSSNGRLLTLKKINATWGNCTLTPTTGTIDGESTKVITTQYDSVTLYDDGTNWYCVAADLVVNSEILLSTADGFGSTYTNIRKFTTVTTNTGGGITYANSATVGASATLNEKGVYIATFIDTRAGASGTVALSVNIDANTSPGSIAAANRLGLVNAVSSAFGSLTAAHICTTAGDVIRPVTDGNNDASTAATGGFRVKQIKRIF